MGDNLVDFNLDTWIKAIHDNWTSYMLLIGGTSRFELNKTRHLITMASGYKVPLFNRVMRTRLTGSNADEKIRETIDYYAAKDLPFVWQVYPGDTPGGLSRRLEGQGLTREEGRGMAMNLDKLNAPGTPEGFTCRKATSEGMIDVFSNLLARAYGMPETAPLVIPAQMDIGFRDDYCSYIGFLDDVPVACSSILYSNGVAGLHNVATLPAARGKGIGSSISAAPLIDARDQGSKVSILLSSKMGYNLYKRLGFVEYCQPVTYVWNPPT